MDGNPRDRSVLVRELVPYLQNRFVRFATEPVCQRYIDHEIEAYSVPYRYVSRYDIGVGPSGGYALWLPASCARQVASPQEPIQAERDR